MSDLVASVRERLDALKDIVLPTGDFELISKVQTWAAGVDGLCMAHGVVEAAAAGYDFSTLLHQHMYVRVLAMQPMIGGVATHGIRCACGWESHGHPNEGFAASAWIDHVARLTSSVGARPPAGPP